MEKEGARLNSLVSAIELWSEAGDSGRFGQTGGKRIGAPLNNVQVEIIDSHGDVAMRNK